LTYYRYFYVYSKLPFRSEFFRLLLDFFLYAVFKEQDALSVAEDKDVRERPKNIKNIRTASQAFLPFPQSCE